MSITSPIRSPRRAGAHPELPPVVLLSGGNALSVARSLHRMGAIVYGIHLPSEYLRHSRHCVYLPIPIGRSAEESWTEYLLGPQSSWLRGAVLLACSDPGLEIIARNRAALEQKYRLDESNPTAQLCMLNKFETYRQARAGGVNTPKFWQVSSREEILKVKDELTFPMIVKPHYSHLFIERFGKKLLVVNSFDELMSGYGPAADAGIEVMLVEMIPGPDDRLCSYYTYLDVEGNALFDFTKRVIRRYPILRGLGCYHITDQVPGVKEQALKLFRQVKLRGLANAEFKLDERDGKLKLIECNARFTAANALVSAAGYDLPRFVYNRIVGRPQGPLGRFQVGKRLWYPIEDFYAFRQLHREGKLTWGQWLGSLAHPKMLPYFDWKDPLPTVVNEVRRIRDAITRRLKRMLGRSG